MDGKRVDRRELQVVGSLGDVKVFRLDFIGVSLRLAFRSLATREN